MKELGPIENLTQRIASGLKEIERSVGCCLPVDMSYLDLLQKRVSVTEAKIAANELKMDMINELMLRRQLLVSKLERDLDFKSYNAEISVLDWVSEFYGECSIQYQSDHCGRMLEEIQNRIDAYKASIAS